MVDTSRCPAIRAAIDPVPATRTVPSGDDEPDANAASQSVTTRIGQRRPAPAHAASNSAATAGSVSLLDPAMPSTPASTLPASSPSSAAVRAWPTWAAATSGGWEFGFAPPATPAPSRVPSRSSTSARVLVPPASRPTTKPIGRVCRGSPGPGTPNRVVPDLALRDLRR